MAGVAGLPEVSNINECDTKTGPKDPAETPVDPSECRTFPDHSVDPKTWGHVYFVQRRKRIKIGHTGAPHERLQALGKPLKVLAIIPNTIISERDAHAKFAHLRVKGEWFRACPELYTFIKEAGALAVASKEPERPQIDLTFENARRGMHALRSTADAKSPLGIAYSTLIEQSENFRDATDTTQKAHLRKSMDKTMNRIAELSAAT